MDARRVPCLKLVMMMTIFVVIIQVSLVASERDMSITRNSSSPEDGNYLWESSLKTDGKCLNFHRQNASSRFFVWPEDQFRYCCSYYEKSGPTNVTAKQYRLRDYVYHLHGTIILTGMYHDLIRVDQCMPYWRCWNSEAVNTERVENVLLYSIQCEFGDLKRLYTNRFWNLAVAKYGILMSALPLIAFLEVGVLLTTLALCPCGFSRSPWKEIFALWWRTISWVTIRSWLHLILLTVVGNSFMEAIGHQDPYTWITMIINNFVKVYLALPIIVSIAAFLQQVVDWRVVDKCLQKAREQGCSPDEYIKERQLQAEFVDDDWKWQPIFMQIANLSLLGLYISYATDEDRTEFVALLMGLAAVASTWSGLVPVITFFRKLDLLRKSFRNDFLMGDPLSEQQMTDSGSKHHQPDSKV